MKKILSIILSAVMMTGIFTACGKEEASQETNQGEDTAVVNAVYNDKQDENKKAILVVSFGTSYADTREKTIGATEKAIQEAFPDYEVRRAFTSKIIIKKLKERDGIEIDTVEEALKKLSDEGFGTVICQPTHIMPGSEYDEFIEATNAFSASFKHFGVGKPLVNSFETYEKACEAFLDGKELADNEAIIAMGHGTEHSSNAIYCALDYTFKDMGKDNVFVTTVEGVPNFEQTIKEMKKAGNFTKVYLYPFMIVAGDHANNDMAGDEEGSLKNVLKNEGYEVEAVLEGLGENEAIRNIFVKRTGEAIEEALAK